MKKQTLVAWAVKTLTVFLAIHSVAIAQTNLGAECGCPPVASRPTANLSTRATYVGLPNDYELTECTTVLTCDTTWILDHKIYVPSGKSIVIQPGTLVKGQYQSDPTMATSLIAQVGGKIMAQGTESCPIVFTSTDDNLTGSYGIQNRGRWGGIVLLGRATNNLLLSNNGPAGAGKLCVSDGVGYMEGYNASNVRNNYGKLSGSFDDNDNSGVLSYVSIRHAGAILNNSGNELNSLSLGSVGRGTKIDHIEIISGDDDAIEVFGGTVNLKYCAAFFGADDMLDYDHGWTGKAQFFLGVKTSDTTQCATADHGIEADADDNKSCNSPKSHPIIYNATFIGNNDVISNGDNSGRFGMNAKELAEGEIYNSVFANFMAGINFSKAPGTRPCAIEAWNNWQSGSLIFSCNAIVNCVDSFTIDRAKTAITAADRTKFVGDGNNVYTLTGLAGFSPNWAMNGSTNAVTTKFDAVPNPALATTCTPPNDGFFETANYRGAFGGGKNWLAKWSYIAFLAAGNGSGFTTGGCIFDLNADGTINNTDFLQLLGKFNQNCN